MKFFLFFFVITSVYHSYSSDFFIQLTEATQQNPPSLDWSSGQQEKPRVFPTDFTDPHRTILEIKQQHPYQLLEKHLIQNGSLDNNRFNEIFNDARDLTREDSVWQDLKNNCSCCFSRSEEEIALEEKHELGKQMLSYLNFLHAFEHLNQTVQKKSE